MLYSIGFLTFVAVLLFIYYAPARRRQWVVLLLGSYLFYAYMGRACIVFILGATILTFYVARKLEALRLQKEGDRKAKKRARKLLVAAVAVILAGILALFKFQPAIDKFSLILPIGISYYSFQVIGYIIDIYRGAYPAEQNIFRYALFVGYFPGMIQGPINRYDKMQEQFMQTHGLSWGALRDGAWLFLWGLFKKLVIADRCAVYVNHVMGDAFRKSSGSILLMGVILFVVQMYGDFSGGIDMAEGISEMFGIRMYQNFRQPFFSQSIGEFWRRWHISLGNWIRDYVFYPLAFSKTYRKLSKWIGRWNAHLADSIPSMIVSVITFVIIGLWHAISPAYLIYGLWYGVLVGMQKLIAPAFQYLTVKTGVRTECVSYRMFRRMRTWLIVLIGESFCILPGVGAFAQMIRAIFTDFRYYELFFDFFEQGLTRLDILIVAVSVLIWWAVSLLKEQGHHMREEIAAQNLWCRLLLTGGIITVIAIFGIYGPGYDAAAFIYGGI